MTTAYINYHRKPFRQFLSVAEYNKLHGTKIEASEEFENQFYAALMHARRVTDPNDYIQQNFDNMGLVMDVIKGALGVNALKKSGNRFLQKKVDKFEKVKETVEDAVETVKEKITGGNEEIELGDFLDDYDEAPVEATPVETKEEITEPVVAKEEVAEEYVEEEETVSLSDEIDSFLHSVAKDSQQFTRDRSHVVHFSVDSDNLASRLMKGRDRYMKRLQQYLDGDNSVKVRMMDNKEILVSALKPNRASLRDLLQTPHGEPRYCNCDC
tara:strand:- start:2119 stop:2925 length:807 start_codon:yes stop_codon:yes gene_type:complete